MRTLKMTMNSSTETVEPYKYIHALGRYNMDDDQRAYEMSSTPCQPDYFQKYADRSNAVEYSGDNAPAAVAGGQGLALGQGRSPFQPWGENTNEPTRGSFRIVPQPDPANNQQTVDYIYDHATGVSTIVVDITEPLFISPLAGGKYNSMGISQLTGLDFDISWDSRLNRMLSIDNALITTNTLVAANAGNAGSNDRLANTRRITNISVDVADASNCKLSFIYLTPQATRSLPKSIIFDYHKIQTFTTSISSPAAPNTTYVNHSQNLSLNCIPSRVYIWLKKREADSDYTDSDAFANIQNISIQFNGRSGEMASASEWDLWRLSSDNGLRMSYVDWKHYSGSVLCLDFGKNIGLGPNQCVGLLGNFDFSFDITWKNLDTKTKIFDLFTLVDYPGTFTITDGDCKAQIGVVSSKDVLEAGDFEQADGEMLERMYGGSFMSGMKNIYTHAQKLKPYAKRAVSIAKDLAPVAKTLAPRAAPAIDKGLDFAEELLGMGYSKKDLMDMKRMGYTKKDYKKLIGGNIVGGARCPKSKLQQRLSTYR